MEKKRLVFSGVQPTGNLHLGNYLGALKNFVSLQKEMNCIYCVVDLHAITTKQDPKILKNNIRETTAALPIFFPNDITVAIVSLDEFFPLTTSSNRITFAGLKK